MAVDRKLWNRGFSESEIPAFLCPQCKQGRLVLDKATFHKEWPPHSKAEQKHPAWEPDWIDERFVAMLRCNLPKCGEVVTASGDTSVEPVVKEDGNWEYESILTPRSMFPAPPIILIAEETPYEVQSEIELSFQFFWVDHGACATRLRKSVELLLDNFQIPREGKDKNGHTFRLSLQERINAFKGVDEDYAATLDALRIVGNLGTHDQLNRTVVLDAYEIYEDAIAELYGKQKEKIKALKDKIIAKQGKY